MKYVNYALAAGLILSTLLTVRETINYFSNSGLPQTGASSVQDGTGNSDSSALKPLSHYAPAVENNVFGIKDQSLSTIRMDQQAALAEEASLPSPIKAAVEIKLLGTVAWADTTGYAFISEMGRTQNMYKTGQTIEGAGILRGVHPDRIIMDFNGKIYEVMIENLFGKDQPEPAQPKMATSNIRTQNGKDFSKFARRTGKNEYVVSKRAIDESIQNPQNILTDARLLPNMVNGTQNGFRVSEIKRGGLYQHLGLSNGDILLAINDFKLSSPESALQAFTTLQGASAISIEVERRGKKISLKYNIR